MNLTSNEIRQRFLDFFAKRGHAIIPSASLVPENDPSVLFTTAGMQQFKPYYTGDKDANIDFNSLNTVSVQKCVRTSDIDEVGDDTHLTFFEMLGNFSFGGYGKKAAITYAWDFITKELEINPERIYVTVLDCIPLGKDEELYNIWKNEIGLSAEKIKFGDIYDNFWGPTGNSGPCGPTTEIYVDGVEIWNIVFNQYFSKKSREQSLKDGWELADLNKFGIDTGMGLERLLTVIQKKESVYNTDLFEKIIEKIKILSNNYNEKSARIVADHVRTAVFLSSENIFPTPKDRGYILRKLIRKATWHKEKINLADTEFRQCIDTIIEKYSDTYPDLKDKRTEIEMNIGAEQKSFSALLENGTEVANELFSRGNVSPKEIFDLYQSYGFPMELSIELAKEKNIQVDEIEIAEEFKKHQELSRAGAEQKFKGGLGGTGEMETKYHTATHLLHQALRDVLGESVQQKGSNITAERLRFDFAFDRKMTDDEKRRVEDTVNEKIKLKLPMHKVVMKKADAEKTGALHFFGDKYGDEVSVYYIGDSLETAYSKEFCGGPHVENTGVLGTFKIQKEEAVSAGVRRIKAVLDKTA